MWPCGYQLDSKCIEHSHCHRIDGFIGAGSFHRGTKDTLLKDWDHVPTQICT